MFTDFFQPGIANQDINSLKSQYAQLYGKDTNKFIKDVTDGLIFNAAPKAFLDLNIIGMKPKERVGSDEFFYGEMGWQREPVYVTVGQAGSAAQKTITVDNIDQVAVNMVVGDMDNSFQATIISVDTGAKTITIAADTGETIPAIADGAQLIYLSPIEGDGQIGWAHLFRASMTERYNFIQLFSLGLEYDEIEWLKMSKNHQYSSFLEMEKQAMLTQFRTSLSNAFWNGKRGEATIINAGQKRVAKKMGGVLHTMFDAGSPNASTTGATIRDAFEDICIGTEFQDYGETRFVFGESSLLLKLSNAYKDEKTRYTPNDSVAKLMLNSIDIGSCKIVLVPMQRFRDRSSFPDFFRKNLMVLDMENIQMVDLIDSRYVDVNYDARTNGGRNRKAKEVGIDATASIKFHNPLACGFVTVTDHVVS